MSFYEAVGNLAFIAKARAILLRDLGACISPFNAFLLLQGLETLSLRVERHVENALKVVEFLQNHPQVKKVNHPAVKSRFDHALYEKYPKLREFIEDEKPTSFNVEETDAFCEWLGLYDSLKIIELLEAFKLGGKEAYIFFEEQGMLNI